MSAVPTIVALGIIAAILAIAGAYVVGGLGAALFAGSASSGFAAWWISRGVKIETA